MSCELDEKEKRREGELNYVSSDGRLEEKDAKKTHLLKWINIEKNPLNVCPLQRV
jgi:hypothetical protein